MTPRQRYRNSPRGKYNTHKVNAKQRGIDFLLTYGDWWDIWKKSKRWKLRGWRPGQYVMCRRNDAGAYAVGNVYIGLSSRNLRDARRVSVRIRTRHGCNYREVTFELQT